MAYFLALKYLRHRNSQHDFLKYFHVTISQPFHIDYAAFGKQNMVNRLSSHPV